MMWITRKTDYATRAVLALALVDGEEYLRLQDLAERTATPVSFLEQIMLQLRSAGIVRSHRGRSGGYRLNHAPEDISLEKVVRLFQGPLAPIECATRNEPAPCEMDVMCSLKGVWEEVRDTTIAILERTTFADLAERAGGRWIEHRAAPGRGLPVVSVT